VVVEGCNESSGDKSVGRGVEIVDVGAMFLDTCVSKVLEF